MDIFTDFNEQGLDIKIVHESTIDELILIHNNFSFLKNFSIQEDDSTLWKIRGKDSYCIQAIFIGKTGYGKSTTLNKICRKELFKTDDINSCTKTLFSAEYKIHDNENYYFSLCDLPGIGESMSADKDYLEYYTEMLKKSHCVVYVMRADQRDYSKDLETLKPMLKSEVHKKKIILAVNFADKIEPLSRSSPFVPNEQQLENIEKKISLIHEIFNIRKTNIVFYSATEEYNMSDIVKKIADIIITTSEKNNVVLRNGFPTNSDGYILSFIPGVFAYSQLRAHYAFGHCHDKTEEEIDAYVKKAEKEYESWLKKQSQAPRGFKY